MPVRIFNYGGGSAAVQLNIKAYESLLMLPATAEDGTVGVITTTAIGNIYTQPEQPSTPASGDVWAKTNIVNAGSVNLLTKGSLVVCVETVFQYNGNTWDKKDFRIWKNNTWTQVSVSLYSYGNMDEDYAWKGVHSTYNGDNWYNDASEVVLNSNHVQLSSDSTWNNPLIEWYIDTTPYSAAVAVVDYVSGAYYAKLGRNTEAKRIWTDSEVDSSGTGLQTLTLDLSSASGSTYLLIGGRGSANPTLMRLYAVYLLY